MRLGTRGSALALAQARTVAELLGGAELVTITVSGDRDPAARAGAGANEARPDAPAQTDKTRWVDAIEDALHSGEIDLAVHSAKDVPGELAEGLELFGAPPRAATEDVLCGAASLEELAAGARVGTSSLRRAAQLRAARADLAIETVLGNVDTRLRKLADGEYDAIVLARAGLQRLGREDEVGAVLDLARFVPAPGQGTLALEGRAGDTAAHTAVQAIADERTFACLRAERALARALGASCETPLGAHARDAGCGCLELHAWVGLPDGSAWVADGVLGGFYDPEELGRRVAERMLSAGAGELLEAAATSVNEPSAGSI
ncbi:MAG TPA: hydroxymethylbilane synthase [Solirubrobacteraceae bacterium]|jgi:hydroxymethylbilane synthase